MSKYSHFFATYNAAVAAGNPFTKEEVVIQFTEGRTSSLRELSDAELMQLSAALKPTQQNPAAAWKPPNDKADKMRKSILAIFRSCDQTTAQAIAWAEKQGKKPFNDYNNQELFKLIRVAERVRTDYQNTLRKRLAQ